MLNKNDSAVMNRGLHDIFSGRGFPRFDEHGNQKIFKGIEGEKWKCVLEWKVRLGNGDYRILTKQLPNGKTQVSFTDNHYNLILDVILK